MTFLVDAHALIWAIYLPEKLSARAAALLSEDTNTLLVSHATLAEILNKAGRGKLPFNNSNAQMLFLRIQNLGVEFIPIQQQDILRAAALPHHHSDPFDRLLIAQATLRQLPILTADSIIPSYDVETIW